MTAEKTITRRRSLLLVHGRDFKPDAEVLHEHCWSALCAGVERDFPDQVAGLTGLHCETAYYGDLTRDLLESRGRSYDEALDIGDRHNALSMLKQIQPRKKFGIRQYDCLPGKSALPEFIADLAEPLIGAFGLWLLVMRRQSPDFAEYLVPTTDYRAKVQARVRDKLVELLEHGDRIMLLTHGTGSVVAWDVLWELSRDERWQSRLDNLKVDTFVTMGSPLGDGVMKKRLAGAGEKASAKFPSNVISWHNVAAEDDQLCHDKTLADDYRKMLKQRLVSAVHDYTIYNLTVRYGRSSPHSSIGYYIHPRISKILTDWLQDDDG